jgi:outer membrane protein TolC
MTRSRWSRSSARGATAALALLLGAPRTLGQEPVEPAAPAPLELTLEEALQIALARNIDLALAQLDADIARYDSLGSWGAFDPVLTATGSLRDQEFQGQSSLAGGEVLTIDDQDLTAALAWPLTTGGSFELAYLRNNERTNNQFAAFDVSTTDSITLSLVQPLLRGAWRDAATAAQRLAEITWQSQLEAMRSVRQDVVKRVADSYWDLVSAREELAVRKLALELGRAQLAQEQRRLDLGAGTEVDVLQAQTNVAQREEERIRADFARRAAQDRLRALLFGRPEGEHDAWLAGWDRPIEPRTLLPDLDAAGPAPMAEARWREALARALARRPVLAQARLTIDTAEIELVSARSTRRPQLDLNLSASGSGFDDDPSGAFSTALGYDFPSTSAGLTFSLPLGNQSASQAERAARAGVIRARLAYEQAELGVLSEVRDAVREVVRGRESVAAATTSADFARRQLDAEVARRDIGMSTTFQVLQFQQDLAQALSTERAARADYAKAWTMLHFAQGVLGEEGAGEVR